MHELLVGTIEVLARNRCEGESTSMHWVGWSGIRRMSVIVRWVCRDAWDRAGAQS
jgi:hypothetical protein